MNDGPDAPHSTEGEQTPPRVDRIPSAGHVGETRDPVTNYPGMQSAAEVFLTLAGGAVPAINVSARFPLRSVRIDNLSGQWLRVNPEFDYIPPYTSRRIFNVRGYSSIQVIGEVPQGGATNVDAIANRAIRVTVYDRPQIEDHGVSTLQNISGAFALQ